MRKLIKLLKTLKSKDVNISENTTKTAWPISVDFLQKDDTDYIMDNKSYLPHGVYADREYSQETERKCKLLRLILKAARQHKDYQGRCKME